MHLNDYLKTTAKEINKQLYQITSGWYDQAILVSPEAKPLYKAFISSIYGGKVIRGTLVKLGYALTSSPSTPEILKPAAAFEILHSALLAHDDIIDRSPTRRGRPSLYNTLGGNHYGVSQTICLGDLGLFLATQIISESNFDAGLKNQAITLFSQTVINTILGEVLDIQLPYLGQVRKEQDVINIHKFKTASYTVVGPLSVGAILGRAPQHLIGCIRMFGENLGVAFQIQDDILGTFGAEKDLGKSASSDIEEGKNTLLITFALQNATKEQRKIINQYYGKGKISKSGYIKIRKVFKETGALDYSQSKASQYVTQAKNVIPAITKDLKMARLLNDLSDFLIVRQK